MRALSGCPAMGPVLQCWPTPESVQAAVDTIIAAWGALHIVVASAGITQVSRSWRCRYVTGRGPST